MSRSPLLRLPWLACVLVAACTDGSGPTESGRAVSLDIRPSFQVEPSLFPALPVDRIRLVARDAGTSETVGGVDLEVSPAADEWALSLAITLGEAANLVVIVDVELLAGDAVQWSGRVGPITVRAGTTSQVQNVDVHRGPLSNLDVLAVELVEPPTTLEVGATVLLVASPTLVEGSAVVPTVYWASTNAAVATVTPEGLAATVTGVSAGTTRIVAVAGSASVERDLEVTEVVESGTRTWVGGAVGAPYDWHTASNWSPSGVPGTGDDVVIPPEAYVILAQDAAVASLVATNYASIDLASFTLEVSGDADLRLAVVSDGLVRLTGPGSVLRGDFHDLEIAADRVLSGYVGIDGDLTLSDATLDVDEWIVAVGTDLHVVGPDAHLIMVRPGSYVSVLGDVVFDGGDHTNLLSNGTLAVEGDFTITDRSPTGFAASGDHVLYLSGDAPQSVTFALPGSSQQRIANLVVQSTAPATFLTSARVIEDVTVYGAWEIPLNRRVDIDGTLTLFSGATLIVDGTVTAGGGCFSYGGRIQGGGTHPCRPPPAADYTWVGGDSEAPTTWTASNNWQPAGPPGANDVVFIPNTSDRPVLGADAAVGGLLVDFGGSVDLNGFRMTVWGDLAVDGEVSNGVVEVNGTTGTQLHGVVPDLDVATPRSLSGPLYVGGNLTVFDPLTVGPFLIHVLGDLSVESAQGRLVINDGGSYVHVTGSAAFDGASQEGYLTEGVLQVHGDFTVGATHDPVAFRSDGTLVALAGSVDQSVSFSSPAPGAQAFRDFYVLKSGGSLLLSSSVVVEGDFYSSGSTLARALRNGTALLQILGGATNVISIAQTTFAGLPLHIATSAPPGSLYVSGITFTNMPTAETQLRIELPGAGASSPLVIGSPLFDTAPAQGAYYLHVVNTTQQGLLLEVRVASPTPSDQPAEVRVEGGPVDLIWPYVP